MAVLPARLITETVLFTRLKAMEENGECPPGFFGNVLSVCNEAGERLKAFALQHGQFTLHDETHCLRVVQLMEPVAGSALECLNAIEVALLILSAYLHDQGMVVDADELEKVRSGDDWKIHEQNWMLNHLGPRGQTGMRHFGPLSTNATAALALSRGSPPEPRVDMRSAARDREAKWGQIGSGGSRAADYFSPPRSTIQTPDRRQNSQLITGKGLRTFFHFVDDS